MILGRFRGNFVFMQNKLWILVSEATSHKLTKPIHPKPLFCTGLLQRTRPRCGRFCRDWSAPPRTPSTSLHRKISWKGVSPDPKLELMRPVARPEPRIPSDKDWISQHETAGSAHRSSLVLDIMSSGEKMQAASIRRRVSSRCAAKFSMRFFAGFQSQDLFQKRLRFSVCPSFRMTEGKSFW